MDKKTKVLYVDDEVLNLKLFELNISKNYKVLTAKNGPKGLEVINNHPDIGVVISDMKMPDMNGIEFIKIAKEKYPEKKYYILTGFEITPEIQDALTTGLIKAHFSKPYEIKVIERIISGENKN